MGGLSGRRGGDQRTVNRTESYSEEFLGNFINELRDFHQAIEEDREPAATGMDGLRLVEVTLAMIESALGGADGKD
jgi:predicted dehydrogenase